MVKESAYQCRRCGFHPWVGKIPYSRKWHLSPVFLPKKFNGQRSLASYSPWSCKESSTAVHAHSVSLLLFSHSVMSSSLQSHGLQHTRLSCPSTSPRVCSNSCPLRQWCHPTISSFVFPFSSCPQSFPASGSFSMSWLFASGGFSFSISPSNEYSELFSFRSHWFELLAVPGTRKSLLQHHNSKASILSCSVKAMVFPVVV